MNRGMGVNWRGLICGFALLLLSPPVHAEWRVEEGGEATASKGEDTAIVENQEGYRLEIYKDSADAIHMTFTLRNGFDIFDSGACPTFHVDDNTPLNLARHTLSCAVEGNQVRLKLGDVVDYRITSPILLQLIGGRKVLFRYQLANVGYQETFFRLKRSKQVLRKVIGKEIEVMPPQNGQNY